MPRELHRARPACARAICASASCALRTSLAVDRHRSCRRARRPACDGRAVRVEVGDHHAAVRQAELRSLLVGECPRARCRSSRAPRGRARGSRASRRAPDSPGWRSRCLRRRRFLASTAVLMPISSPLALTSAPPELPTLMAASVWMKFSKVATPSWPRPVALTMPWVTVCDRPSGLPMASTTSPTCSWSERPSGHDRQLAQLDLQHRQVGVRIAPDDLASATRPSASCTLIWSAFGDHVVVGDDVAVVVDDHARAEAALHALPVARPDGRRTAVRVATGLHALGDHARGVDVDHGRRARAHRVGEELPPVAACRRRRRRRPRPPALAMAAAAGAGRGAVTGVARRRDRRPAQQRQQTAGRHSHDRQEAPAPDQPTIGPARNTALRSELCPSWSAAILAPGRHVYNAPLPGRSCSLERCRGQPGPEQAAGVSSRQ